MREAPCSIHGKTLFFCFFVILLDVFGSYFGHLEIFEFLDLCMSFSYGGVVLQPGRDMSAASLALLTVLETPINQSR